MEGFRFPACGCSVCGHGGSWLLRARDGSRSGGGGVVGRELPPASRQIKANQGCSSAGFGVVGSSGKPRGFGFVPGGLVDWCCCGSRSSGPFGRAIKANQGKSRLIKAGEWLMVEGLWLMAGGNRIDTSPPAPMASQARHESVSRGKTFASRNVVPERGGEGGVGPGGQNQRIKANQG
jgi:hypothetical protein